MRYLFMIAAMTLWITETAHSETFAAGYTCSYQMYGTPWANVHLLVNAEGHVESNGVIELYGSKQATAVKEREATSEELYSLVVDADRPGQEIFLTIFKATNSEGQQVSQLVNQRTPVGGKLAGLCSAAD